MQIIENYRASWTIFNAPRTASNSFKQACKKQKITITSSSWNNEGNYVVNYYDDKKFTSCLYGIIRDPVSWYLSGYRYNESIKTYSPHKWKFHTSGSFTDHLKQVKSYYPLTKNNLDNNIHIDDKYYWVMHCVLHPMHMYKSVSDKINKRIEFIKFENIHAFCRTKDIKLPKKHINDISDIPWPQLTTEDEDILEELYSYWPDQGHYNFQNCLNTYKEKVNET